MREERNRRSKWLLTVKEDLTKVGVKTSKKKEDESKQIS